MIQMDEGKSKSLDVLGIKPIADAVNTVTKAATEGASAFLSRICLPAAEEFGLLLKDKVSAWRAKNAVSVVQKAEKKLIGRDALRRTCAHPRLVVEALERGSWTENEIIQEMWAGLLASSCTEDGRDDSNLIFMDLLSRLTVIQVLILKHACESAPKYVSKGGWPVAEPIKLTLQELETVTKESDFHRLDRELDFLRSVDLIINYGLLGKGGGFDSDTTDAHICPSALALHLYVRSQGYVGSPVDYFGLKPKPEKPS